MRHLLRIEQRAAARPAAVGGVGVPGEARVGEADMLAGFVADIGNQQDLREPRKQVFLDDVDFELAETQAEIDMPLARQPLSAEDDHNVVVKDALDLAESRSIDVLSEIEGDLRAARRAAFPHRWPHQSLASLLRLAPAAAARLFTPS